MLNEIILKYLDCFGVVSTKDYLKDDFGLLAGYKSIIVFGLGYPLLFPNEPISNYALINDYHQVVRKQITKALEELQITDYYIGVDSHRLDEKYLGYLAKIGTYGKNNLLINPKLGSQFFIGVALVKDEIIYENKPLDNLCINCDKCLKACPTNALENGYQKKKCLSYQLQKKLPLMTKTDSIWGCDHCINSCPLNKHKQFNVELFKKTHPDNLLEDIYNHFSNYQTYPFYFRGKQLMIRNILAYTKDYQRIRDYYNHKTGLSWFDETINYLMEVKDET